MMFDSFFDIVSTFLSTLLLIFSGVMFKFFPNSLPYKKYRTYDDPERYINRGFANYAWADLTPEQWDYAKKIAPKIFFITAIINLITVLAFRIFINNMDNTIYIIIQVLFLVLPNIYMVKKAEKFKRTR